MQKEFDSLIDEINGLIAQLKSESDRANAMRRLREIGPAAAVAVPNLIELLQDSDHLTRRCAAASLGQIGPPAAAAVPNLVGLLYDPRAMEEAGDALEKIGPSAVAAVPSLVDAISNGKPIRLRWKASEILGKIGPAAAAAVPELVRFLKEMDLRAQVPLHRDFDGLVRTEVVETLGKIGPAAVAAVPALHDLQNDRYIPIGLRAAIDEALREICGK